MCVCVRARVCQCPMSVSMCIDMGAITPPARDDVATAVVAVVASFLDVVVIVTAFTTGLDTSELGHFFFDVYVVF